MRAAVANSERVLARQLCLADTVFRRMKGLLGKRMLPEGEGLWIRPCKGVHTFGMRFAIDVVFLDRRRRVVALFSDLRPNRMTPVSSRTTSVIELPAGKIAQVAVKVGDEIVIS